MRLVPIPNLEYEEYRLKLMFDCYKWDPQFLDNNTVAKYALVLTKEEHEHIKELTEKLDKETRAAEMFLNQHPEYIKPLALPRKMRKEIALMKDYEPQKHIRLMRYDFHPTTDGEWAVSEVNSDVPGGWAEASLMPQAAKEVLDGNYAYTNFGENLCDAIQKKVPVGGRIMLVHCTSYSDDRQVMQFLGDKLETLGFQVIYAAADHLRFKDKKAISILDGNEGEVDAIIRFSPLEWVSDMKPKHWSGYFDTTTCSCNHPIAIYAQTKRFPFVWDILERNGISMETWRDLLPETLEVKAAKEKIAKGKVAKEKYIYKPVYGRVGEMISIKEACQPDEYKKIMMEVNLLPKQFLAQKKFISQPLAGIDGEQLHICLGSYTVDGAHAGYYARVSKTTRIDSGAADIPVLIEENADVIHNWVDTENKECYKTWAPSGKKWTDWVRPVPFISACANVKGYHVGELSIPTIEWIDKSFDKTAIIVDLPGDESIEVGLALAKCGYRPIPIYNGTIEQKNARATVDNQTVGAALLHGAKILKEIEINDDALPVFLTDKNRLNRFKIDAGIFDNSWDVYPQDLPSADYFLKNGIERIVVISDSISRDLRAIFRKYKKKNLSIHLIKR